MPCGEHSPPATHSTSHIKARGDAADASGESLCSRCRRPRDTPVLSPALSLRGHGAKGNAQQAQQTCLEEAQSLLLSCSAAECAVGTGAAAGRAGTGEAGSAAPSVTAPCGTSGNDGDTTGRSRSGMSDALEALQWGRAAQNTGRGSRAPQPAQHDGTAKWRQQPPHQGGFLASGSEVVAEDLSASGGGAGEWWQVSCKSSTAAQCGKWSSGSFESKGTASDVEEPADHGWAYWKKSQVCAEWWGHAAAVKCFDQEHRCAGGMTCPACSSDAMLSNISTSPPVLPASPHPPHTHTSACTLPPPCTTNTPRVHHWVRAHA